MIRVRFAPSPTGLLHIGGARTALFNWMYARSQNGAFILRIEDTDKERSSKEFLDEILQSLTWLGLTWDELYYQSERFELYREYAARLLKEDAAYKEGEAIILRMPQQEVKLYDLIRGEIVFDTATIKDQVLIKSDGSPTYSFACVVDDALMKISHVIRGEDHISNTPKQIVMYAALGFAIPKFAHLPLIMGEEGGRLSKRTGAVAVSEYRAQGFLPEALVNYLMLLGWSPGANQEMVSMKSALQKFSIKKINKTAAVFSLDKLKWLNAQYIKQMDEGALAATLKPVLIAHGYAVEKYNGQQLEHIIRLYKSRMSTFDDFLERTRYLFVDAIAIDPEAKKQHLTPERKQQFSLLCDHLGRIEEFNAKTAEEAFRACVSACGVESSALVHAVRVALTGMTVGIGLFDTMAVLGKEEVIKRLNAAFDAER